MDRFPGGQYIILQTQEQFRPRVQQFYQIPVCRLPFRQRRKHMRQRPVLLPDLRKQSEGEEQGRQEKECPFHAGRLVTS